MARSTASSTNAKPAQPATSRSDGPLLTKESYEQELKTLAETAKKNTWSNWAIEQGWILLQSGILLTLAAIYSAISQLTLSPVYGSIPSSIYHEKGVLTTCFIGWSFNILIRRRLAFDPVKLLPLIAAYIPMLQFFLFQYSDVLGARYGPVVTESLTYFPLLLLSISCTATVQEDLDMAPGFLSTKAPRWISEAGPGIISFFFFKTMQRFWSDSIMRTIGASFYQTRFGLRILMAGIYSVFAPSKLLLYAFPAVVHATFFNTHIQLPYTTSLLNTTLQSHGWSLIDRQESLTGYISVIESNEKGFRAMRCDHSLLGGSWISKYPRRLAEPIYGVFVMLEAVRLVEVPEPIIDKDASALVIGLGIGTTPAALIAHGISTTIVEIDPVVHAFATKHFGLPPNHEAVIDDAVAYASAVARSGKQFDYIIHDVFTGGAEPVDLFTLEFLQDLYASLKPGGVIAINYAGDLLLPSARIVIRTIRSVFPSCRIYRESEAPSPEALKETPRDFTNLILFCSRSSSSSRVTFRSPTDADYLGSAARQMFLMPRFEVLGDAAELGLRGDDGLDVEREAENGAGLLLRRNTTEMFKGWQERSAVGHWAVMRTVIPPVVWESW